MRGRKLKCSPDISSREFYLRSFTWGLPLNVAGGILATGMIATGHRPKRYGECIQFEIGERWGGASSGIFIFTGRKVPEQILQHEHGHSIQNCFYGPLMPFIVNLPSTTRYLGRKLCAKISPRHRLKPYDSAWFEAEATKLGREHMKK